MAVADNKTLRSRATDREALEERARRLFTVPTEIPKATFERMDQTCQDHLSTNAPNYYKLVGNTYVLQKSVNELPVQKRLEIFECLGLPNGIKLLSVDNIAAHEATLSIRFYNQNYLKKIFDKYNQKKIPAHRLFPISGGHRLPAGAAAGMVQAKTIALSADETVLTVTVGPVGDYSTYKLSVNTSEFDTSDPVIIDPLLNEIDFKFRPGCFNVNCAPDWPAAPEPDTEPVIDYLAKDYDSFRHTMMAAMMQRVPGWQPSSEADLDQVLLELFSGAADELSDYQDRVMNEAYLSSARKRVSLARHARLMDYHIHQGNQASTWLALEVELSSPSSPEPTATIEYHLAKNFEVWAGGPKRGDSSVVFLTRAPRRVHQLVNRLGLYTWGNAIPSLVAGDTTADLKVIVPTALTNKGAAVAVQDLIRSGVIKYLLVQEHLNPVTGTPNGFNPQQRQLLRLLPGDDGAKAMYDPTTTAAGYDPATDLPADPNVQWFVRVRWEAKDELKSNYCFTVDCPQTGEVKNVSLFHGNLVEVTHGHLQTTIFKEPGTTLTPPGEFYYERVGRWDLRSEEFGKWGTICALPARPLAYLDTEPGGDVPPQSTLSVEVSQPGAGKDYWDEVPSLIHSDDSDESGDHFVVETDEERLSFIRFGNGRNGKELPENAEVTCTYQVGDGPQGNIGLDKLINFNEEAHNLLQPDPNNPLPKDNSKITRCWNPFDITNGRAPEPAVEIIRRAPEAYRLKQRRAVTLQDYVKRAEELPEVSRAAARYAWTGSWRTVRITIDPVGTNVLEEDVRRRVARYLNAVRLIGEDLEIRPPQFVPLEIHVKVCAKREFWPEDLSSILGQEFSDGWTPDGRQGFFHPDLWTFGQSLLASQIIGRVLSVEGVEHVISVTMKRWNSPTSPTTEITALQPNEIIQVLSDPDHLEQGFIDFEVQGGRG
jgi:hypothetical protein